MRSKRNLRRNFFTEDFLYLDEQPEETIEGDTIMTFKRYLDRCMNRKDLESYGPNVGKSDQPSMPTWSA